MHGETEWDMWDCDPRRYTAHADDDYALAKAKETYGHEYAMHFPHHAWPAGRDKKLSPLHGRLLEQGAQMGAFNGWERALWFAKTGDDTSEDSTQTWDRNGPWAPRVKAECLAVRDHAGVLDLTGFSRFALSGAGAAEWLRTRIAGAIPKIGRMMLAYFSDSRGRFRTEMSVLRHGEDEFTLITAAAAQWHDYDVLAATLPDGLVLEDRTEAAGTLLLTGPASAAILGPLTNGDLSRPWMTHQQARVCGHPALMARVSFAGELGWELHAAPDALPDIYDALRAAGATPFGMFALDSLRLEKGYRTWKGDLSSEYTLLELGVDRFVTLNKAEDFPGKAALLAEQAVGSTKRFVSLIVETTLRDAKSMATVLRDGAPVGEVTSAGYGYRIDAAIAHAIVTPEAAVPGTKLTVEIFGETCTATVQAPGPLYDPQNLRIRAVPEKETV